MKFSRSLWSGLAAVALMGGLITPAVLAPSAAAAPVISSSSVITQGASGSSGISLQIAGSGFKLPAAGLSLSDFNIGGSGSGLTALSIGTPGSSGLVTISFTGTAVLNGTITVQAKRSAYSVDPGADSNTLTFTVGATVTQPTIASSSVLVVGAVNPVLEVEVTNSQVRCCGGVTPSSVTVVPGGTGLTLTNATSSGGNSTVVLTFTGTVAASGTLTVELLGSALNPSVGGTSAPLSFTVLARPVIGTSSTIANGASSPTLTITGSNFASGITDDSLIVTTGTTGLTRGSVVRVSASELTVPFTGTAAAGTVTVVVKASGFDPVAALDSTTVSVVVPAPAPTGDVLVSGSTQTPTIAPSSISVAAGGTFTLANTSANNQYFVRGSTGAVSSGGTTCTNMTPCVLNPLSTLTLTVVGQGNITIGGGTLTIGSAPGPNPNPGPAPTPPSSPTQAAATAGDAEATISWQAPTSQGSFPVTNYQVQSTPSSQGCLTSASVTSCRITGLRNGVAYTFQVRALNGGGWGPWADTASVTPRPNPPAPSITISGSRVDDGRAVRVSGVATSLSGVTVNAWIRFPGQSEFTQGSSRVVSADGTLEWKRTTGKRVTVYFETADGGVKSNRVTISAR